MKAVSWGIGAGMIWVMVAARICQHDQQVAALVTLAAAVPAIATILFLAATNASLSKLIASASVVYLALRIGIAAFLDPDAAPVTPLEALTTAASLCLGGAAIRTIEHVRKRLYEVFVGTHSENMRPFSSGQQEIYREFRRARAYQRPLTMLALSCEGGPRVTDSDRFVQRIHQEMIDCAALARVASLLARETTDCDVVVQHGNALIAALPATQHEEAVELAKRVTARCASDADLKIRWGCATFPRDGITVETVLERAVANMGSAEGGAPAPATVLEPAVAAREAVEVEPLTVAPVAASAARSHLR